MTFHVGQRVVCVDVAGVGFDPGYPTNSIVLGGTYTIRWIGSLPGCSLRVLLNEVHNRPDDRYFSGEGDWYAHRFRPITERKTDISIFTKLLTPTDKVTA